MARFVAPLLAGIVIGGGAGYAVAKWIAGDAAPKPTSPDASGVRHERSTTPNGSDGGIPTAAPALDAARRPDAQDDAPPHVPRKGVRSIRGRVVDREGRPLAGFVLKARRFDDPVEPLKPAKTGHGASPDETLADVIRVATEEYYARASSWRETTTRADGGYAFDDLFDGRWTISAWREGFEATTLHGLPVRPDATVDFTASAVVSIEVAVEFANGTAAPKAALEYHCAGRTDSNQLVAWSPAAPRLGLAPGDWTIRATLGDPDLGPEWRECLASAAQSVVVASDVESPRLRLRLAPMPGIRGVVRFANGDFERNVVVHLVALPPGASPELKLFASGRADDRQTWTHGTYLFRDLKAGRYLVGIGREWISPVVAHAVVEVAADMVVQDFEVPAWDPSRCWFVTVRDPRGRIIDDVGFELSIHRPGGGDTGPVEGERQPDGSFQIPVESIEECPLANGYDESDTFRASAWPAGVRVELTVTSPSHGRKIVDLVPSVRRVEIAYLPPAHLVVSVPGFRDGGRVDRLSVTLQSLAPAADESHGSDVDSARRARLGADGTLEIGPVEPGEYSLQLWLSGVGDDHWNSVMIAANPLSLASGENRAELGMPSLHSLVVDASGIEDESFSLQTTDGLEKQFGRGSRSKDSQGRVEFTDLVVGDYFLSGDSGGGVMRVQVPTTGVVRFDAAKQNALSVEIEDEKGRLHQIGLESEDVVFAVDGREYADSAALKAAISARLSQKRVVFTIVRAGRRIELTVDGTLLANPFQLGGTLSPTVH
jgi:hypothetical protein